MPLVRMAQTLPSAESTATNVPLGGRAPPSQHASRPCSRIAQMSQPAAMSITRSGVVPAATTSADSATWDGAGEGLGVGAGVGRWSGGRV